MKTLKTLTAIATLLTLNVFAQTGPEYLTITVNDNTVPAPVSMTMIFSDFGAGMILIPNHSLFPFTITNDSNVVREYDFRPIFEHSSVFGFGLESDFDDTITIQASSYIDTSSFNQSANETINYVYLEDLSTGVFYQILDNTITLTIPANSTFNVNYKLHVIAKPTIQTFPVTCFGDNNGSIAIHNPYCTNWNYTIYDNIGIIRTASVFNPDTTLAAFTSEFYTVTVYMNGLLVDSEKVLVDSPEEVIPYYVADNYSVYAYDAVLFMNASTGAENFAWTFGDSNTDNTVNPTHSYGSAGDYPVTLTATNANGCNASFTDTIHVIANLFFQGPNNLFINDPNFQNERPSNSPDVDVVAASQRIMVNQNVEGQEILVQIMNLNGQVLHSTSTSSETITFDFLQAGVYLVNITTANGNTVSEKVIVNN